MKDIELENMGDSSEDSDSIEAIRREFSGVGYDWEIDEPGATLVEFKLTRAELMTLLNFYLDRYGSTLEVNMDEDINAIAFREMLFCGCRLKSIAKALGFLKEVKEDIAQMHRIAETKWT